MKKIFHFGLILAFLLVLVPVTASANGPSKVVDLFAGQDIDVGEVQAWNDATNLYVKYVIDEPGWCLTETHLHVAENPDDIPQTKNGNPIPGHFDFNGEHPCIDEVTYTIPWTWGVDTILSIAAHAEVKHSVNHNGCFASDTNTEWYDPAATGWTPAFATWVHPSWPPITDATWIWRTAQTDPAWEYANVPTGGWEFRRLFEIPGSAYNITGTLEITADNSYSADLNAGYVGTDGSMNKDGPDTQSWSSVEAYDISTLLEPGSNALNVHALNYFSSGIFSSNPAGLIFKLCSSYDYFDQEESAWGSGLDFDGNNWATYFTYTVEAACPALSPLGDVVTLALPLTSVVQGASTSHDALVFAEYAGTDHGGFTMDIDSNNTTNAGGTPHGFLVAADVAVCSYYVHFDDGNLNDVDVAVGSLTFDAEVMGLIVAGTINTNDIFYKEGINTLCDTDDALGNDGTSYEPGATCGINGDARGLEFFNADPTLPRPTNQDPISISGDKKTVSFDLQISNKHDSFRIILPAIPAAVP